MNLETRTTSYFFFYHDYNEVYHLSIVGDAITTAKNLKIKGNNGCKHKYHVEDNTVNFETKQAFFHLDFQNDGLQFNLYRKRKSDNKNLVPETYAFLNWNNL